MRKKLTNTVIAKLAVPEGKQSVKLFDTDVGGLGVRKMELGVATFIWKDFLLAVMTHLFFQCR